MTSGPRSTLLATAVAGALCLVACGSGTSTASLTVTATATLRPTPSTPSATPAPSGPFALLVTNSARQGATYDVLLVDATARVVARTTAKLPLLKAQQTIDLPLATASAGIAYYLDGDTAIHALKPDGTSPLVKTVAEGAGAAISFAVSPDNQRIVVSAVTQRADDSKTTGHGYIEDLHDSAGHVDIFNNTAADAYRWPLAWFGNHIVDAVGSGSCGQTATGNGNLSCASSLHIIDATSHSRTATICEAPTGTPGGPSYSSSLSGPPSSAGIACSRYQQAAQPDGTFKQTCTLTAYDLSGGARNFLSRDCSSPGAAPPGNCMLAPDGARMACQATNNQALVFLSSSGVTTSPGHKYNLLGWIDTSHLIAEVDANTLAVVDVTSGSAISLPLTGADQVSMMGIVASA